MKITHTSIEADEHMLSNLHKLDLTALVALATLSAQRFEGLHSGAGNLVINASAEQLAFASREVTGEDIVAMTGLAGGKVLSIERDETTGLITSIEASIPTCFEYDSSEMSEVLESLHATAPAPAKLLGDLAQTSVGTSGGEVQVIGLAEWSLSWKRKTADATTTDDAEYESSLGSTKSWSVKAKYMFIDGDSSQQSNIYSAISTLQNDSQIFNFFPTVATGRAAFQGACIIDGIDIATGMGKCVGTDVSLKGTGPLTMLTQAAPQANTNTVTGEQAEV